MLGGVKQSLGRYVSRESAVHRLDPSARLVVFILIIASVFTCRNWVSVGLVTILLAGLCVASRVGLTFYLRSLKYFAWMFALSFAVNVIFPRDPGTQALSLEAVNVAGVFSARLGLMVITATVFTVTTAPHEIGDILLGFTGLRGRAGRRVADLATIVSVSLRFVPVMFEEAERIKTAQMLRGQEARGPVQRVRGVINLMVPLFQSSLRKSTNLGFALESRCYGYAVPRAEGPRFGRNEALFVSISLLCFVGLVLLRVGVR